MLVDSVRDTDDWRHLNVTTLVTMGGIRNSEDELYYTKETYHILANIQGKKRRQSDSGPQQSVFESLVIWSTDRPFRMGLSMVELFHGLILCFSVQS